MGDKELSEAEEMARNNEVLQIVAKRLRRGDIVPQFEKFLDVLEVLADDDGEDSIRQEYGHNRDRRRKYESSIETLQDVLRLFNNKDRIQKLYIISEIFDTEEKLAKLEKLAAN